MFSIVGGNYNGMEYSAVYHCSDKYEQVSRNERYYFIPGIVNGKDPDYENLDGMLSLLMFDIETDELVYAQTMPDLVDKSWEEKDDVLLALIEKLHETLGCLMEPAKKEPKIPYLYRTVKVTDDMMQIPDPDTGMKKHPAVTV